MSCRILVILKTCPRESFLKEWWKEWIVTHFKPEIKVFPLPKFLTKAVERLTNPGKHHNTPLWIIMMLIYYTSRMTREDDKRGCHLVTVGVHFSEKCKSLFTCMDHTFGWIPITLFTKMHPQFDQMRSNCSLKRVHIWSFNRVFQTFFPFPQVHGSQFFIRSTDIARSLF